jgi:serralysin
MATAISATAFIDTLGVNTHLGDAGAYSDTAMVEQNLEYLGVTIVRDSVISASEAAVWQQVAQATGVKFDDYMPEGAPAWDQATLTLAAQLAQQGVLAYVEGGNEEDDPYAQANGNSLAWTAQFQQQVYAMGQEYDLPVINMSFGSGWTAANNWEGDYPDVGDLSAYTNYANAHTYPNVGQTPNDAIAFLNSDAELAASSRPVITTEIGWQTSQFSETQIAQYVVDATFDGIADGDAGMWFYGLYDDSSGDWGLFNADGTARPAATALHDLTTLLADPNAPAGFTPGSLNYTLSGTQSGDNSILIEKSDGSFWIGLWTETGSQHTVTVNLPGAASEIEVFDPVTGTTAIQTASNAGSIAVSLGGDPLLIEIVGASTGTGGSSGSGSGSTGTGSGGTSGSGTGSNGSGDPTTPTGPSIALPASESVATGSTTAITGVSVTDAFAASNPGSLALTVSANSGDIAMTGANGAALPGSGTDSIFVSGTLVQINAWLATLTYTAGSTAGSDSISIDVWDQAGLEADPSIPVTIAAAATSPADPTPAGPSIALPASESLYAGSTTDITGVSVTDAFAASNPGAMVLNVSAGTGDIAMTGANGTAVSGSGTQAISVTGTLAQINADLATLTYTAGSNSGSDAISINVWDQAGLQTTEAIAVTVAGNPPITIAASNADPVELVSASVITATSGNHLIFIGGTGDTVTATGGTETVQAFQGGNTITTGAGNDTISFGGSGNTINAGGGNNTLQDSGSYNTIVMPGAGNGFDNIFGYVLQSDDTLDFRAALANTAWTGTSSTLGNFIHLSTSSNNAIISISNSSNGTASRVAELQDSGQVTLSTLLAHALT